MKPSERLNLAREWAWFLSTSTTALIIDADNKVTRTTRLTRSLVLDQVFAVKVRDDVIALDLDLPDSRRQFSVVQEAYPQIYWLKCNSGSGCRSHMFAYVPDAEVRNNIKAIARKIKADVRLWIRPPYTMHRSGLSRSKPDVDISVEEFLRLSLLRW